MTSAKAFRALLHAWAIASLMVGTRATIRAQAAAPPYKNAALSVDARVRDLVGRMTLEEKFWQLFMSPGSLDNPAHDYSNGSFGLQISAPSGPDAARGHAERINTIQKYFVEKTRLGIPIMPFEEALHGLKTSGATVFPQAIGLAATFDTALMARVATAIARETRSRGIRDALSPVINIGNDVRWGRIEETYGEDPYLASRLAVAFVRQFEQMGVVTTPKHFIANVGEGGRDSYPIYLDERFLDEVHFPPFVASIRDGGSRSVMSAYNSVDGAPATQNGRLLNGILKREWGFGGFVISDAAATGGATVLHMTEQSTASATKDAFEAGLDVVFQSTYEQARPYLAAFKQGVVADSIINASVARVLRAKFEIGLFEHPYVNPDSAAYWNGHADHRALAREAGRASLVLLRNERDMLPLAPATRIAVIGQDASEARLGGYSGTGIRPVSILDGIRERAGAERVLFAPGPGRVTREYVPIPREQLSVKSDTGVARGLKGEYWDNNRLDGPPRMTRIDPRVDFGWTLNSPGRGIPFDWYSVRWTGQFTIPAGGIKHIGVEGNDGFRLWLDGKLVLDNWRKQSYSVLMADVTDAKTGTTHDVKLEFFESTGNARIKLVWDAGVIDSSNASIDSAVAIARKSDVAVVVVGLEEGEFRDRAVLKLPGDQEALLDRVIATRTPVVVIVVGGSAFDAAPWIRGSRAILAAWYPGEEGGHGVADVLFGDYNPAARLPITYPISEGQLPLYYNHRPTGRGDDYLDLTGQPLFPFGFGLSYTTFEYSELAITPDTIAADGTATVKCRIKNAGTRAGDEVAQLYIRDLLATRARPVIELKGFQRVSLAPGESKELTFRLSREHLQMLDASMKWVVEPGAFRVMIGASSKDIRLRGELRVR